jgi:hypothetical protein
MNKTLEDKIREYIGEECIEDNSDSVDITIDGLVKLCTTMCQSEIDTETKELQTKLDNAHSKIEKLESELKGSLAQEIALSNVLMFLANPDTTYEIFQDIMNDIRDKLINPRS